MAQGVRDYLCNRMYSLNEERVEAYLSQLVALALQHPSPALARLCVDLCSRSARLACKVHWLLSAYAADERAVSREAVRALQTATEEAAAAKWAATPELVIEHTGEVLRRARSGALWRDSPLTCCTVDSSAGHAGPCAAALRCIFQPDQSVSGGRAAGVPLCPCLIQNCSDPVCRLRCAE